MSEAAIPVMKPLLPIESELRPYLQRIDEARYYSNHGALVREFEGRLATHFGVEAAQVSTVANGTIALSAALLAAGAEPGKACLVPSWTFVASAAAIWSANLRPHFIDVCEQTWMLDPETILQRADLKQVGAVMPVSAFGAPVDTAAWDRFTDKTGIPVVIDAAAGFDTISRIARARVARAPIMVSLHATKVFGIGEGAAVLSTDADLVTRVRQICNFGVWGPPEGQVLGYNGKLSEYHAAVGLAAFRGWEQRRAAIDALTLHYRRELKTVAGVFTSPYFGHGWVSCYCNIRVRDARELNGVLIRNGIETRRWWRDGVSRQPAYRPFSADPLPVTEALARGVTALPFYHDLERAQVDRIVACVRAAQRRTPG